MNKRILFVFVLVLVVAVFLGFSILFSPSTFFKVHVMKPIPRSVFDIKFKKDLGGMHGPVVFVFKAKKESVDKIIKKHGLKEYATLPPSIKGLVDLFVQKQGWEGLSNYKDMEIYGKLKLTQPDWHCFFLLVEKGGWGRTYIIKM